jgi:integrase
MSPNAHRTILAQEKPVRVVTASELGRAQLDWPAHPDELRAKPLPKKSPRPHQKAAIDDVLRGFQESDRGQLIMACGTGKTMVSLWVWEALDAPTALVVLPSLSLLAQTVREWCANAHAAFDFLAVCLKDGLVKRGSTWAYVVSEVDGDTGKKKPVWHGGFACREDARVARDDARDKANKGHVAASRQLLADYLDAWLATVAADLAPSTLAGYKMHVRVYLKPRLGDVRLCDLTRKRAKTAYAQLRKTERQRGGGTLSRSTVDRIWATLRSALSEAVDDEVLVVNAAATRRKRHGRKPKGHGKAETPKLNAWTGEQVATFLEAVRDDRLAALWRLAAMTGMRRAELTGLRGRDVEWKAGVVDVRHTLTAVHFETQEGDEKPKRGQAVRLVDGEPKSGKSRPVDLDAETLAALKAHKAALARERLASPLPSFNRAGLLFVNADGTAVHPDYLSRRFRKPLDGTTLPRIRLHDLRHTHASLLLAAGVPVHVVAQRLGHADPGFTMRVYGHLLPRQQRDAAELVAGMVVAAQAAD